MPAGGRGHRERGRGRLGMLAASINEGMGAAPQALEEWRLFFIAVEEFFALRDGSEWGVVHQRLARR